jgi:hypothetical protein
MAKNHPTFKKSTQSRALPAFTTRELPPRIDTSKKEAVIQCPFCLVPHPISVGKQSPCGTTLRVTAVQTILPARTVKKNEIRCIKCHKMGGEMVPFNNGYVHLVDCTPGTKLLAVPPKFSRAAQAVFLLPEWLRTPIERVTGRAQVAKEVDPEGRDTGKTLGYFFFRGT